MKICPKCGLRYPNEQTNCFIDREPLGEAPDPYIGKLIKGQYRIEGPLGEGGMAMVYAARHTINERRVAIKIFRKELARDPKLRERFRREATSCQRLNHPSIIEILDHGDDDDTPFLVMEFLDGESLESLISKGRLPLGRAVDIVLQAMAGIARAHDFKVVHRDLKPDNLFVVRRPDGRDHIKILDFGIARSMHDPRLTGQGEVFGTPQYMAPERITSIDAGPSADLYAMGVILYELCAGRLPFEADDISSYLLKHLKEKPVSPRQFEPTIPPALESLILRLLEKDPAKRPSDAHAVVKELQTIAAGLPRWQPVPAAQQASAAAAEPARQPRAANTLAPATLERWERRVMIFTQMLSRTGTPANPQLEQLLERVRLSVTKMGEVRSKTLREQMKLDALVTQTRETQRRLGHAMQALGEDRARFREELAEAQKIDKQYEDAILQAKTPFGEAHRKIASQPAEPSSELSQVYRQAIEALDRALYYVQERTKVTTYLQAKQREISDTEYQIEQLRTQSTRHSSTAEDEQEALKKALQGYGGEMAEIEQTLMQDASTLADALRGRAELRELFSELEHDVP